MIRDNLLVAPVLNNVDKYLKSCTRTEITDKISKIGKTLKGETDGLTLSKNLLL